MSGDEFLNVADQPSQAPAKHPWEDRRIRCILRQDSGGELSTFSYRDERVGATVQHERGNPHAGRIDVSRSDGSSTERLESAGLQRQTFILAQ
jgi:hypothetical protein